MIADTESMGITMEQITLYHESKMTALKGLTCVVAIVILRNLSCRPGQRTLGVCIEFD